MAIIADALCWSNRGVGATRKYKSDTNSLCWKPAICCRSAIRNNWLHLYVDTIWRWFYNLRQWNKFNICQLDNTRRAL